ncbi:hypothetical protein [Pseudomonas syringae]|uniref:hypothetical protein n=1 Tax=Pseudomonas syringae TaxID=317 RepID=UPI0011412210|nr:hypothetical protein [Pseudomonas syringae]
MGSFDAWGGVCVCLAGLLDWVCVFVCRSFVGLFLYGLRSVLSVCGRVGRAWAWVLVFVWWGGVLFVCSAGGWSVVCLFLSLAGAWVGCALLELAGVACALGVTARGGLGGGVRSGWCVSGDCVGWVWLVIDRSRLAGRCFFFGRLVSVGGGCLWGDRQGRALLTVACVSGWLGAIDLFVGGRSFVAWHVRRGCFFSWLVGLAVAVVGVVGLSFFCLLESVGCLFVCQDRLFLTGFFFAFFCLVGGGVFVCLCGWFFFLRACAPICVGAGALALFAVLVCVFLAFFLPARLVGYLPSFSFVLRAARAISCFSFFVCVCFCLFMGLVAVC